jgi:Disulphide bond corrector protein DsbC
MKLAIGIVFLLGFLAAPGVRDRASLAEPAASIIVASGSLAHPTDDVPVIVTAPHLQLTLTHSGNVVTPGMDVHLIADVQVAPEVHVYAPGVKDYRPLELTIGVTPGIKPVAPSYPKSKLLFLRSINQDVPVFEGKFRVVQDVNILSSPEFITSLQPKGKTITVTGELKYQACTLKVCFLPASVPLKWELQVVPPGRD